MFTAKTFVCTAKCFDFLKDYGESFCNQWAILWKHVFTLNTAYRFVSFPPSVRILFWSSMSKYLTYCFSCFFCACQSAWKLYFKCKENGPGMKNPISNGGCRADRFTVGPLRFKMCQGPTQNRTLCSSLFDSCILVD